MSDGVRLRRFPQVLIETNNADKLLVLVSVQCQISTMSQACLFEKHLLESVDRSPTAFSSLLERFPPEERNNAYAFAKVRQVSQHAIARGA